MRVPVSPLIVRLVVPVLSLAYVALSAEGCANRGMRPPQPQATVAICTVTRGECIAESLGSNGPQCDTFQTTNPPLIGTACSSDITQDALNAACTAAFCTRPQANPLVSYDFQPCTATGAVADQANLPTVGTCAPLPAGTGSGLASISYHIHQRSCTLGEENFCTSFTDDSTNSQPVPANCVDLTMTDALDAVPTNSSDRDILVGLSQVVPNDPRCTPTAPLAYDLTPGPLGQATGGGTTAAFALSRGSAVFSGNQLFRLSINLADLTVAGTKLSNVRVTNSTPAPLNIGDPDNPSHTGIAAGKLNLVAIGLANGAPQIYHVQNDTKVDLTLSGTALKLSGTFKFNDIDPSGNPLPISITFTALGTPSTPATKACAAASPRDRLFGFEDPQSWSSTVATLTLVTSPVTQGCGALGIAGQGYMPINSVPFTASGLTVSSAVSVDLFIPNNQPNQFYLGALQMYLTCPSVSAFNEYVGQVEITGKPQNAFSTLRFPLPTQVTNTLRQGPSDCSWGFALNANQTNRTWILDNLRFTN
jgi:hypothetical protein